LALDKLRTQFEERAKSHDPFSDGDILGYLMSQSFIGSICSTRAVPNGARSEDENRLLRRLINEQTIDPPEGDLEVAACNLLVKEGIVARRADQFEFSAPLISAIYIQRLYASPRPTLGPRDLEEFLENCIQRMNPKLLQGSFSKGAGGILLERAWQMEFYRVATSILPGDNVISPDVGKVFGSDGFLDFYVNGDLRWAIELMREGNEAAEHEDRFKKGGLYYAMRQKIKSYAILDFRGKEVRKMRKHFWYIIYNEDYTKMLIKKEGCSDKELKLVCNL